MPQFRIENRLISRSYREILTFISPEAHGLETEVSSRFDEMNDTIWPCQGSLGVFAGGINSLARKFELIVHLEFRGHEALEIHVFYCHLLHGEEEKIVDILLSLLMKIVTSSMKSGTK